MAAASPARETRQAPGQVPGGGLLGSLRGAVDAAQQWFGRLVRGDRPLVVFALIAAFLGLVLLSGPMQSYLDARGRVEVLEIKEAALTEENERLLARVADLNDPARVEGLAREQLGFIRPGEVPYTLVPPEVERPRITAPRVVTYERPAAWHERLWQRLEELFGGR